MQTITSVIGKVYKLEGYVKSGTAGANACYLQLQNGGTYNRVIGTSSGSWVKYSLTFQAVSAVLDILLGKGTVDEGTMLFDTVSAKEVLTPSVTGVTIVSTLGGTTYNWTSKETGFNYNDPAGYTCQIFDSSDSLKTLNKIVDGTGTAVPTTPLAPTIGITYKVVIKCSTFSVGSCAYTFGGVTGSSLAAATTYTDYITCTSTANLTFTPTNTSRFTIVLVTVSPVKRVVTDRKSVKWGNNTFHSFGCSLVTNNENVGYEPLGLGVWQKVIHEDMLP